MTNAGLAGRMAPSVVTSAGFAAALASASQVSLSAYVLDSGSGIVRALEACGDRGARVTVILERAPYTGGAASSDATARRNDRAAAELARHGVEVQVAGPEEIGLHMKAAVVDGTAYLDDRNWPNSGANTIVATSDPDDVAVVVAALAGRPSSDGRLATEKRAALALEANAISVGSGDRVDVETESFGYCAVSKALFERACAGARVRLLVTQREYVAGGRTERASLARLAAAGVSIRVAASDEKLCVAGDRGWAGSANATYDPAPTLDWGMALNDPAALRALGTTFERNWAAGRPVQP
jgi:phosphatidylserine/phosphatidylglycerophosphate/cardiolipin synthase-like enzyme